MSEASRITGFEVYKMYLALKNHFTKPNYDYHKYNGVVNVKETTYKRRRDRWHFEKIAKKYNRDSFIFVLSNLVNNKDFWPGNAMNKDSDVVFKKWIKYTESGTKCFKDDMLIIKEFCDTQDKSFDSLFDCEQGRHPVIWQLLVKGLIQYPTFCILESGLGFSKALDKKLKYDPIWDEESLKLKKASGFCPTTKKNV